MKRVCAITLLILLSSPFLFSSPTIGFGGSYRYDSVFIHSYELDAYVRDTDYAAGILSSFDKALMASGRYTLTPAKTLKLDFALSAYHAFATDGGMANLSVNIGQDLNFSGFAVRYRLGLIGALAYSTRSRELHYSFSPNLFLEAGVDKDGFAFLLYIAGERFFEKSFQSIPIFGARMAIGFYNQRIIFDSHIKLADYMEGPTLLISDIVFSLGYEVDL